MKTIAEICDFLELLAPAKLAEDWDNFGLLVGRRDQLVKRVLTCLTLTPDVAEEAVAQCVGLIVSHHPVLFRSVRQLTDTSAEGQVLLRLIEAGVGVYSPHTAFDSAANGINQQLARALGVIFPQPLRPFGEGQSVGSGRFGDLSAPTPLADVLGRVHEVTGAEYLEFVGAEDCIVNRVAVACGSAGEFLTDAITKGCDVFVTGEARFHTALEARTAGISLVLMGHYESERPAVEWLAMELSRHFPEVVCIPSAVESNPLQLHMSEHCRRQ